MHCLAWQSDPRLHWVLLKSFTIVLHVLQSQWIGNCLSICGKQDTSDRTKQIGAALLSWRSTCSVPCHAYELNIRQHIPTDSACFCGNAALSTLILLMHTLIVSTNLRSSLNISKQNWRRITQNCTSGYLTDVDDHELRCRKSDALCCCYYWWALCITFC